MTESIDQVAYYCGCSEQAITGEEELPTHCPEHGDHIMPRTWERIERTKAPASPKGGAAKFGGTSWAAAFRDYQKRRASGQQDPQN